jgi:DNA-binding CsgD family transcriptional regulator
VKGKIGYKIWGFMTSAILDTLDQPATAVMGALAMHAKPHDFCRELAMRALNSKEVSGVFIVEPTHSAELHIIGQYGTGDLVEAVHALQSEIELSIREKYTSSLRLLQLDGFGSTSLATALVPSSPMATTSSVLVIFYKTKKEKVVIDRSTQVALSFACEMYCSPNWANRTNVQLRSKRNATDEFGELKLSSRQKQVLELMSQGKTNERIARTLNYSVATIKNDISAVFQFLGVNNRHDAIAEAERLELLPPPNR